MSLVIDISVSRVDYIGHDGQEPPHLTATKGTPMTDPMTPERRAEAREAIADSLAHGKSSETWYHHFVLALLDAADERDRLAAQVERVRELTYESDDGTRYGCDGHSPGVGYAECPGCWSDAIETALGGGGDE